MITDRNGNPIKAPSRCVRCKNGWFKFGRRQKDGSRKVYCQTCGRFMCEQRQTHTEQQRQTPTDKLVQRDLFDAK